MIMSTFLGVADVVGTQVLNVPVPGPRELTESTMAYQDAIALFTEELRINPSNENAYYERGNAKYALNDYYGALQDMDNAIEINPHPAFINNRSAVKSQLGDYKGAIEDASKAINLKPNYVEAYVNRAGAYGMLNENEKTILDYSKALSLAPENIVALLNRGVAFQKIDKIDKACKDWHKAANLGESNSMSFVSNYCK